MRKALLMMALLALCGAPIVASGPVGVYAVVDKVVFEPNETGQNRIQIWGVFSVSDDSRDKWGASSRIPAGRSGQGRWFEATRPEVASATTTPIPTRDCRNCLIDA